MRGPCFHFEIPLFPPNRLTGSIPMKLINGCSILFYLLVLLLAALVIRIAWTEPGTAPRHAFDLYRPDPQLSSDAFDGKDYDEFDHVWILRSPDLKAWWHPNGMRAEADLIMDSADLEIIREILKISGSEQPLEYPGPVSGEGYYHVLLFNQKKQKYAHLRYQFGPLPGKSTKGFALTTYFDGSTPVKIRKSFIDFEEKWKLRELPVLPAPQPPSPATAATPAR